MKNKKKKTAEMSETKELAVSDFSAVIDNKALVRFIFGRIGRAFRFFVDGRNGVAGDGEISGFFIDFLARFVEQQLSHIHI